MHRKLAIVREPLFADVVSVTQKKVLGLALFLLARGTSIDDVGRRNYGQLGQILVCKKIAFQRIFSLFLHCISFSITFFYDLSTLKHIFITKITKWTIHSFIAHVAGKLMAGIFTNFHTFYAVWMHFSHLWSIAT